jgi:hypothetical protein
MSKKLTEQQLAVLNEAFPVSSETNRVSLPRFGMLSKDITETVGAGKNKKIKVIESAGTFYTESDEGEVSDEGKKVWTKKFIEGAEVDVIITYHRRQLRMYDSSLEKFYSTPVYDNKEQVLPLYLDKQIVMTGTQAELQAKFPTLTLKGKPSSKLKEETILFIIYNDELYQMNLSQSSKWTFKDYAKKVNPSTVITTLGSVEDTFGDNTFSKVTFTNKCLIDGTQFEKVNESQEMLKEVVASDDKLFLSSGTEELKKF